MGGEFFQISEEGVGSPRKLLPKKSIIGEMDRRGELDPAFLPTPTRLHRVK